MNSADTEMKCVSSFRAEMSELRQLHLFFKAARETFPRYAHVLRDAEASKYWYAQEKLDKIFRSIEARDATNNKALLVMAWGSFEQFTRHLIKEGADALNIAGWNGRPIPEEVYNQHALVCSSVLSADIRGDIVFSIKRVDVATDMRDLICKSENAKLNSEALSAFGGKFTNDQLAKLGKRIGVDLQWQNIGNDIDLQKMSTKNGNCAVGEWAEKMFCEIRDTRNRFVHRGVGEEVFEWEKVEDYIEYLEKLSNAVALIVSSNIQYKLHG